ncbi:hypothetical protein [Paraburkholderia elongata]|uniref:Uncharacterized protein n=1 Tax=Paraburkholderia elongata TaxID=2675747 RepID=A0A972SQX1_9BURK|nr:hypothetical protein [Paraburkholderia elongata]NPT62560.1 hypothetical protein [Paraburkholderia elongata]
MTKPSALCRSVGRSAKAAAAGTHLAQSQAPGTHCHLTTAVAPANPQTIASVPIGRQLAEHLTAPQRRGTRSGSPHTTLLTAAAIPRSAALYRLQFGSHVAAAPAPPEPHVGAAILKRDKIAEGVTRDVATRRKGPFRRQGGTDTLVHER